MKSNRRNFVKSMLAVPFVAPAINSSAFYSGQKSKKHGHKFKISLNAYSFNQPLRDGEIDLFDILFFCAKYNFDAVDPTGYYFPGYPQTPTNEFMMKFKRLAFTLGLDISGTGVRNDFAIPDKKSRNADIAMIKAWTQAAAKMGIPAVRIFAGTNTHEGFSRDQVFEWMAKDIKECCNNAKNYGVIMALQNHNDFIKTAGDVNRIFEMVDSEWLKLNLDIGSYRQHDPYEEIEKNIQYAVTWQIKENVWINGKETPTDFVRLFRIIKKYGYRGYLPLETLGDGNPFEKVPMLLQNVKNALQIIESE